MDYLNVSEGEQAPKSAKDKVSVLYGHHRAFFVPLIQFLNGLDEKITGGSAMFDSDEHIDEYFNVIANEYGGKFEHDQKTKDKADGGRDLRARNNQFCNIFRYEWGNYTYVYI